MFESIGLREKLGYRTIQLYEFIKREYEKKRLPDRANFTGMFESTIDIFN